MNRLVSVIVPVLNEAENLEHLLPLLEEQDIPHQTIVVDGGSEDESMAVCGKFTVSVASSRPGRGQQLIAGVELAKGDVLLFLHADSRFPKCGLQAIRESLRSNPTAAGGNFRLVFDGEDNFSRWLNGFYARIRARGYYYGDSGIFVRREIYNELGGIRPLALMEDYDFVQRLQRTGNTICIDAPPLMTSSRRFEGRQPASIVAGWLLIHLLFKLRVPPPILAKLYRSRTHAPGQSASTPTSGY